MSEELIKERERIKEIISKKLVELEGKAKVKKTNKGRLGVTLSSLKDYFNTMVFLIDNPDYVRLADRKKD